MEKDAFIKAAKELGFSKKDIVYFVEEGNPKLWEKLIEDFRNIKDGINPGKPI